MDSAIAPSSPCRAYVVMTYARCGATYFAQLLGSTGVLGRPEDWFNGEGYRKRGHGDYPLDREGQLVMWRTRGASANGVVGLKLSARRLERLAGFDWTRELDDIRFVHLTREDLLDRAISDARSQQTGQYRSTSAARGTAHYDAALIRRCIADQARDEAQIRSYFATNGIVPLELTYEQLLADERGVLARIAAMAGVSGEILPDRTQVELVVQRDEINTAWRNQFLSEHRKLTEFAPTSTSFGERVLRRFRRA